ncbi:expansin EXLX1 family cellulose-binding protein [Micromonospora halotolerans]|uniref:Expansin EXLX1 family cellulose-binding protein n=1 Tax=Micromonospora halotolerans TaxID=709879 RepID=A0ABY9ZZQ6_9ACTN|nr:expansin EXLX1 family cellulose-binding protein [Micromonospora halotolerans]WNM40781.1 expansin EXLX1 family cellulose-binding protein [Micromonospora halotolerans]
MTDGSAPGRPLPTADQHPPTRAGRRRAPAGPRRRLAAGGLAALAAVVAVTLAVRGGAAPACAASPPRALPAAPPLDGTVHSGKATFYDSKGAGGNCSRPAAPTNRLYVALGPSEYAAGTSCGGHLDVTGPQGTVRVLVMDQCPECEPGHLDLSAEAFARIADPVQGIVKVSYRAVVDPPLPGPLTFRVKEGASQWWFAVLIGDHGNPLRAVDVRQGASWRAATRQDYNYWLIASGAGPGPYTIRVTDAYGHRATATGIRMLPGQVQRSTVRMYGAAAPTRSATPRRSPSARPSPRKSASATPTVTAPPGTPAVRDAAAAPPATPAPVTAACD